MAHSISSSFVRLRLKEPENVNWFPAFFALDCLPCDVNVFIIWKSLAGFRLLRKWRSLQTVRPILLIKKKKHKKELYLVTFLIIWLCRVGNYYYCWVILLWLDFFFLETTCCCCHSNGDTLISSRSYVWKYRCQQKRTNVSNDHISSVPPTQETPTV